MKSPIALVLAILAAAAAPAQEPSPSPGPSPAAARERAGQFLRVTVVLAEYDGQRRVSSLPYALTAAVDPQRSAPRRSSNVRMGVRLPLGTEKPENTYLDVGTDLDCDAFAHGDGRFDLYLTVRRTSFYKEPGEAAAPPADGTRPVLRTFGGSFPLLLADGQTSRDISITDPVSGHVLKMEVTANLVR